MVDKDISTCCDGSATEQCCPANGNSCDTTCTPDPECTCTCPEIEKPVCICEDGFLHEIEYTHQCEDGSKLQCKTFECCCGTCPDSGCTEERLKALSIETGIPIENCGPNGENDGKTCICCVPPHYWYDDSFMDCVCDKEGNTHGITPRNDHFVCCPEGVDGYAINPDASGCCAENESRVISVSGAPSDGFYEACCPGEPGKMSEYDAYWDVDHAECCPRGKLKPIYGTGQYECCA